MNLPAPQNGVWAFSTTPRRLKFLVGTGFFYTVTPELIFTNTRRFCAAPGQQP